MNGRIDAKRQRGNVLLSVMIISAVLMSIGATIYNHYIVSEAESVDKSLVDIRAYWAMMGGVHFALGRAAGAGLCDPSQTLAYNAAHACASNDNGAASSDVPPFSRDEFSRAGSLQYFLDVDAGRFDDANDPDLSARDVNNPGLKIWRYPVDNFDGDMNVPYSIGIRTSVNDLKDSGGSPTPTDGRLRIDLRVRRVGSAPVLSDLVDRTGTLTVGICVFDQNNYIDPTVTPPGVVPTNAASVSCASPQISTTLGSIADGRSAIQFIQWNKSY